MGAEMKDNCIKTGKGILFMTVSLFVCILSGCSNANFGEEDTTVYPYLTDVQIARLPQKRSYEWGEPLDLAGLVLTGFYNDGTRKDAIGFDQVTGYNPYLVGEQSLDVIVNHKKYPDTSFTVTVFVSLELTTLQAHPGEKLSFRLGLTAPVKVEIVDSTGVPQDPDFKIIGKDITLDAPTKLGAYTIKITATSEGRDYSWNYILEVEK